jgi:hypothetical protein
MDFLFSLYEQIRSILIEAAMLCAALTTIVTTWFVIRSMIASMIAAVVLKMAATKHMVYTKAGQLSLFPCEPKGKKNTRDQKIPAFQKFRPLRQTADSLSSTRTMMIFFLLAYGLMQVFFGEAPDASLTRNEFAYILLGVACFSIGMVMLLLDMTEEIRVARKELQVLEAAEVETMPGTPEGQVLDHENDASA